LTLCFDKLSDLNVNNFIFVTGVTVYTPTSIQNQSHVIAMFESGAGVEVIENKGHMTARVYLPMTFLVLKILAMDKIIKSIAVVHSI